MPGIVTHHMFGADVYGKLSRVVGETPAELDAFLLGNLGPDPFLYLAAAPAASELRHIGSTMHRYHTEELLGAMHARFVAPGTGAGEAGADGPGAGAGEADAGAGPGAGEASAGAGSGVDGPGAGEGSGTGEAGAGAGPGAQDARTPGAGPGAGGPGAAYALGFLCPYLLDSPVHPLVYAQQHAICSVALRHMKGEWPHRIVHSTIETALDEYVLTTRLGATAATLPPHKTMLRCRVADLAAISRGFADVLPDVYGVKCPDTVFVTAVSFNRAAQRALDSKSAGLRKHVDYLGIPGVAPAYVRSLSHRDQPLPSTPFTNDDHVPWPVPFSEGEIADASFDELYASALALALEILPAYAQPDIACGLVEGVVGGRNFLGRAVQVLEVAQG